MLDIAPNKVAEVIILAREMDRAEPEFDSFVARLNVDEQASLVALMWIGRGTFDAAEITDAIQTARQEATAPTQDYLKGTPHLADHLETALDALGIDVRGTEDDVY